MPRLAADATAPAGAPSRPIRAAPNGAPARPAALDGQQRFAAYVAHELRTPIAIQLALVEATLSDPNADPAAYRTMAKHVLASCQQQQRLIDALLQLTLVRGGLTRHEPVDIAATISHALRAHDLGEFQTIVALKPAQVTGDPVLIERLAANLISNAARHNLTGGRIEIETRTENEHAVLCVANTGRLIAARELTRVFEPFHRLERQPRARDDGLGLGLAIVRTIADAHHATITAHAPPDGGLKVAVRFPTTTQRNAPLSQSCDTSGPLAQSRGSHGEPARHSRALPTEHGVSRG